MFYSALLAVVKGSLPVTPAWSVSVGIIMILSNLVALAIGRYAIQNPGKGPAISGLPALFTGFGVPELLAIASFGHILGLGLILGLSNAGVI